MSVPTVPITPIGKAPSSTPTVKSISGSAETFSSSYDPVRNLVTITETGGITHVAGPVKNNPYFAMQFTSANGNIYKITAANVT